MKRTSWRTFLSGGAVTLLSGHARASLTATGDNFTNRSAPKGGDQSSKGQPEAAKDNPPRTPKAQRLLSLTLRLQHGLAGRVARGPRCPKAARTTPRAPSSPWPLRSLSGHTIAASTRSQSWHRTRPHGDRWPDECHCASRPITWAGRRLRAHLRRAEPARCLCKRRWALPARRCDPAAVTRAHPILRRHDRCSDPGDPDVAIGIVSSTAIRTIALAKCDSAPRPNRKRARRRLQGPGDGLRVRPRA